MSRQSERSAADGGAFLYCLLLHEAPSEPPRALVPSGESRPRCFTPRGATIPYSPPVLIFGWIIVSMVRDRIEELRWK